MIGEKDAIATIAVKDIQAARKFYTDTLGLKPVPTAEPEVLNYKSGNSSVIVYKSQYAGTNKATAANWHVDDVEKEARDLKAKGVAFEHYDIPGLTQKGDVYVTKNFKTAWFKDPDGNILAIMGG
jgi:catechol 2,3-dioxygenase-like lactoylglutathione lyase family enzyme